jgi:3-hydroxymyristoyl/3-hydroxydecanoyl-(acyl carrier protein) dehydratase
VTDYIEALAAPQALSFPPDAAYYDGHFNGNPVTPAIAQIGACLERLAPVAARRGQVARPVRARFFAVIDPGDTIHLTWKPGVDGSVEAALHRSGQLCSRITFKLADAGGGQ